MTPAEKLDINFFINEKNADIRTEFVRKYGIDRMVSMGQDIDTYKKYKNEWWTKSQYKLINMAFAYEGLSYCPHLYMLNQTVPGVYHVEAVSPKCKTIQDALNERYSINISEYDIVDIK
jgi:hypothetical protein